MAFGRIYAKLLLTALFWGGTFIAGRIVAGQVPPFSAAFLRFAVATGFLALLLLKTEGRIPMPTRGQLLPILAMGLTGVFSYNFCFFKGLQMVQAGRAAVIIANNPVFIALFSALLFGERLRLPQVVGIGLSVTGAILVITRGEITQVLHQGLGPGELLIFGCVLSWVTFTLIGKKVLTGMKPLTAIFYASSVGGAALLPAALAEGMVAHLPGYRLLDWAAVFYLGFFGTVLGFVWFYDGIRHIGPTRAGLFINFVPVSAVILAFLLLQEPLTVSLLAGTLLVCAGVYLTNTGGVRVSKIAPRMRNDTDERMHTAAPPGEMRTKG